MDYKLDTKKSMLYAVSIGYSQNPLKKEDLCFTYE